MRQYVAAMIASINTRAEFVAPHTVARFAIPFLFLAGCGVGYAVGQFQNLVAVIGVEPVRSTFVELTQIQGRVAREDVAPADYEAAARQLRAVSNKYAMRIRNRDQFTLRKRRRACLADLPPAFDVAVLRWRDVESCGRDASCVSHARSLWRTAVTSAQIKLDECVELFRRKEE